VNESASVYQDVFFKAAVSLCQDTSDRFQKEIVDWVYNYEIKRNFSSSVYLSVPWLKKHLSGGQVEKIAAAFMGTVDAEINNADLRKYGFGGFDYVLGLAYFFDRYDATLKGQTIDLIQRYLSNTRLIPQKRVSATRAIEEISNQIASEKKENLIEMLEKVVVKPYAEEEMKVFRKDDFSFLWDVDELKAYAVLDIEVLNHGRATKFINLMDEIIVNLNMVNGPIIVKAVEQLALNSKSGICQERCVSWLYQLTAAASPPNVQGLAAQGLTRLLLKSKGLGIEELVVNRLSALVGDSNFQVRYGVAKAVMEALDANVLRSSGRLIQMRQLLLDDIHIGIRGIVSRPPSTEG
jgi:hypothetical protein